MRDIRKSTEFIILHTTEGGVIGALEKLSENGECHYVVDTNGRIYSIIDKTRVAYHAGLSMWNGKTSIDDVSIGVELVGYHDKDITPAQYAALRQLLAELKRTYRIPDDKVLPHSMVAFGNPNRWQAQRHRGRKRCGMMFATNPVRQKLGLYSKPASDPDIRAGRLVDADPELTRILFGGAAKIVTTTTTTKPPQVIVKNTTTTSTSSTTSTTSTLSTESPPSTLSTPSTESTPNTIAPNRSAWDIARDLYAAKTTTYTFPDGTTKRGDEVRDWKREMQPGVTVDVGAAQIGEENVNAAEGLVQTGIDGSARELAGSEIRAATTFYFQPGTETAFKAGSSMNAKEIDALPHGTKMLVGYKRGGPVSAKLAVFNICGLKWNNPDTYYLDPSGKFTAGDKVDEKNVKPGTWVFYK